MRARGERKIIAMIAAVGVICIFIVVLSAYAAELKCGNNAILESNEAFKGEIDTLDVKIKSANSIDHLATVATSELGMVYAKDDQCVYLSQTDEPTGSLAMTIRENTYN